MQKSEGKLIRIVIKRDGGNKSGFGDIAYYWKLSLDLFLKHFLKNSWFKHQLSKSLEAFIQCWQR
jgi:hypothetical protein